MNGALLVGMLFLATLLNYLDRLSLSLASVEVLREFHLSVIDYGHINAAFSIAYAIMYALSGPLVDRHGARRSLGVFIGLWSLAQALHGFTVGKWSLLATRGLLGLAEPGNWPAAAKTITERFPPERRGTAMAWFNSGSSVGAMAAPFVIVPLMRTYGWRAAFWITGGAGVLLAFAWSMLARREQQSPPPAPSANWRAILRSPNAQTLMLARFLTDPVPAFVMFWLPQYLARERGLVILHMVAFLWVPYAVSDLAYLAGGWLSDRLVRRGFSPSAARRRLMYWGAALMPAAFFVPLVPDTTTAIGAVCVMAIGHSIWSTNLQTMAGDLFPAADVGKSTGFAGGAGAIGGSIANYATGYVVASSGFGPVFFCAGLLHLTAAAWLHRRLR